MGGTAIVRGLRVLVVEDDPLIALDIQEILTNAGVVVVGPVSRVDDALRLAEISRLDAAILDVRLEVGTSLPLADRLQAMSIPFLFQTSDPGVITAAHAAAPVLRKPFHPSQLIATLQALLAKS